MTRYTQEIEPLAREAGALLMSYFSRRIGFEYKGDVDLVTAADRASIKAQRAAICHRYRSAESGHAAAQ